MMLEEIELASVEGEFAAAEQDCLDAITSASQAWIEWATFDRDPFVAEAAASLLERGLLEQWSRWDGLMVTLAPITARRLGVKLIERGTTCTPSWRTMPDAEWFYPAEYPRFARELPLEFAANLPAPEVPDPSDVLIDEWTGEPIELFAGTNPRGIPVRREKGRVRAKKRRKKAKR